MKIRYQRSLTVLWGLCLTLLAGSVWAQTSATNISGLATNIQTTLTPLINLTVAACYFGGTGFCAAAIFKFKAHKDNPTQVPIGGPIMLLFVGVALLFLPSIVTMMSSSMGLNAASQGFNYSAGSLVA